MTCLYPLLFFLAVGPVTLDQVRSDPNAEHRAKAAVDFAAIQERAAEQANDSGDEASLKSYISNVVGAMEVARDSFAAAGKTPSRQPGSFKSVELKSHDILHRMTDLRDRLDLDLKPFLDGPIMKIQEIHDAWFDGIMGKKK